jgi:hypothetical protein
MAGPIFTAVARNHAVKAIMQQRGCSVIAARSLLWKAENAPLDVLTKATGLPATAFAKGVIVAAAENAGVPVGQFGDGSLLKDIWAWFMDPANQAKLLAFVQLILKIIAMVAPLFAAVKFAMLLAAPIDISKLRDELDDLAAVQQDALDKRTLADAAEADRVATEADNAAAVAALQLKVDASNAGAVTAAAKAKQDADVAAALVMTEIDFLKKLLDSDPDAIDPTPAPIPVPVPTPDPAPAPAPAPPGSAG